MQTLHTATRTRWIVAAIAFGVVAGLSGLAALPSPASADPPSPHLSGGATTDTCAARHRTHTAPDPSTHTSARDDEFAGVLNRHAECSDCHNPHALTSVNAAPTASGWL